MKLALCTLITLGFAGSAFACGGSKKGMAATGSSADSAPVYASAAPKKATPAKKTTQQAAVKVKSN